MIVVASTAAPWKCEGHELGWLSNWETVAGRSPELLQPFLALEWPESPALQDSCRPLVDRLAAVGGALWRYWIDDGEIVATSGNRIHRICAGRNLATEFALRTGASHCLFVDTDMVPPADAIAKLLDVGRPLAGGYSASYCLNGPRVMCRQGCLDAQGYWGCGPQCEPFTFDVREHWNTAGALLVARPALRVMRWGWDPDAGLTDDPWYQARAVAEGFGQTWVRRDCQFDHTAPLVPVENRRGEKRYA